MLNGVKPLHIDDAAYYHYAVQAAEHPLDLYGFEIFWYQFPQPAFQLLAPPVLPYWWSCAIHLFGDWPFLWKVWLFPFSALFVFALNGLYRRFAPGFEGPLTWVTVLSPTFLPSFNLMLDVPSLALRLYGTLVFLRACDHDSVRQAMIGGIITGFAMETKYTGFLGLAVIMVYAILSRKVGLGIIATMGFALVFGVWEGWIAWAYGESHFSYHYRQSRPGPHGDVLIDSLFPLLGGLAPYVTLLGLAGLRVPARALMAAAALMIAPYVLLGLAPERDLPVSPNDMFGALGLLQFAVLLISVIKMFQEPDYGSLLSRSVDNRRIGSFLLAWMIVEFIGYLLLTPFLAVRRVMGLVIVATILVGRLLSTASTMGDRRGLLRVGVFVGVALGLLVYLVDFLDARAEKCAVARILDSRVVHPRKAVWFVGHWGFQFYAERARMRPIVSGRSTLLRGDWLAVPDERIDQQGIQLDTKAVRLIHRIEIQDHVGFRTVPGYYDAWSSSFLQHREGPRLRVQVYEVIDDFTP